MVDHWEYCAIKIRLNVFHFIKNTILPLNADIMHQHVTGRQDIKLGIIQHHLTTWVGAVLPCGIGVPDPVCALHLKEFLLDVIGEDPKDLVCRWNSFGKATIASNDGIFTRADALPMLCFCFDRLIAVLFVRPAVVTRITVPPITSAQYRRGQTVFSLSVSIHPKNLQRLGLAVVRNPKKR